MARLLGLARAGEKTVKLTTKMSSPRSLDPCWIDRGHPVPANALHLFGTFNLFQMLSH